MSPRILAVAAASALCALVACGGEPDVTGGDRVGDRNGDGPALAISAIPDQDPDELAAREEATAAYLSHELDVEVEYVPVTDYAASVSLFRAGDLDVVFFGGLTGVQARLQTPGATLLAQRDIDADFRSVFIANTRAGIEPIEDNAGLRTFAGSRFTFGSESSTSGRLMPEYFLRQAGVDSASDFAGEAGYSGSHDTTIELVQAGSYEGGALNAQVWLARKAAGTVDLDKVVEVYTTPGYHDYHWMAGPRVEERFGEGFTEHLRTALLALDGSSSEERELLAAYGAGAVITTKAAHYHPIQEIARELGLLS